MSYAELYRRLARPLKPLPTGAEPVLPRQLGVRAVVFDIYGTLLISASGEVGTTIVDAEEHAFVAALAAVGLPISSGADPISSGADPISSGADPISSGADRAAGRLHAAIRRRHDAARQAGMAYPEIDIREVWQEVLQDLTASGGVEADVSSVDLEQLAVHYEARINPVWPMPGLAECLTALAERGFLLGVISNAQFYTKEIFPAFLDRTLDALGFAADLQYYSYEFGEAKPGQRMYRAARDALSARGVDPRQVLYIGNDMLNDIVPAREVGFRTGLFAGDARSLRMRDGDERVAGVMADLVVTDLTSLPGILEMGG